MTSTTVLIVEDEPLVRLVAADIVEDAGYTVVEATNADEAIDLLETRDDIAILFTDIDMPGAMDGVALAALVRDRWPPVRIIVTSGQYARHAVTLPDRGVFVPKPYREADLVATLAAVSA